MIRYSEGDIFAAGCEALVNPVNCVGVMGAGLAREMRRRFPEACKEYLLACQRSILEPGGVVTGRIAGIGDPRWVIHAATKMHWRQPSRLHYTGRCLDAVAAIAQSMRIRSVAVPALGCGLGGLEWSDVRQQMDAFLGEVEEVEWVVFPPRKGL